MIRVSHHGRLASSSGLRIEHHTDSSDRRERQHEVLHLEVTRKTVRAGGVPNSVDRRYSGPLTQEAPNLFVGTVDPDGRQRDRRIEVKPIVDGVRVNDEDLVDGTWAAEYELLRL